MRWEKRVSYLHSIITRKIIHRDTLYIIYMYDLITLIWIPMQFLILCWHPPLSHQNNQLYQAPPIPTGYYSVVTTTFSVYFNLLCPSVFTQVNMIPCWEKILNWISMQILFNFLRWHRWHTDLSHQRQTTLPGYYIESSTSYIIQNLDEVPMTMMTVSMTRMTQMLKENPVQTLGDGGEKTKRKWNE